jgi:hypothetical protein
VDLRGGMLLAWAENRERIACVANVGEGGEVRIFDVGSDGKLEPYMTVLGTYAYDQSIAVERRRAFSLSGSFFVFAGDAQIYIADLRDQRPRVTQALAQLDTSGGLDLSLAADEATLVVWDNALAVAWSLEQGFWAPMYDTGLAASPCNENPLSPDWCGRGSDSAGLSWAPEAILVSFLGGDGTLAVKGFEYLNGGVTDSYYLGTGYESPIASSHRFQP